MSYIGLKNIDDTLTWYVNTQVFATGVATDADSAPGYRLYEDETATPLLTGSMALIDSANTAGFYSEQVTLSAANGFEVGKSYTIYISATVSGVAGATHKTFQVVAPPATAAALAVVDGIVDAILLDTAEIGTAGAGLTNINLPNQTMDIIGSITGNLSGSVGSVTGAVGSVTGNVGGNVVGSVASVTAGVTLANDAITAAKFDETTAFPLAQADSGASAVARTGADADTLETLSDEIAAVKSDTAAILLDTGTDGVIVGAVNAAALADFFDTDSGTTYASAVAGSVVKEIADNAGGSSLTAADIADAVWDEATAGHVGAGSFGKLAADVLEDTGTTLQGEVDGIQADTEDIQAKIGTPAGASVSADIAAVKAETASILTDTAEIGAAGAGLTAINLPDQTMNITGDITGNVSGSVGSVTGAVGSVTGNVGGNVAGSVGSVTGLTASNLDATISSRLASASYTAPPSAATIAAAVWAEVIDGTRTAIQLARGWTAALLGKANGLATTNAKYRNIADTKDVIDATVDADGNRSNVTLDLS